MTDKQHERRINILVALCCIFLVSIFLIFINIVPNPYVYVIDALALATGIGFMSLAFIMSANEK